jgi:PAS domain S-box-containing protein
VNARDPEIFTQYSVLTDSLPVAVVFVATDGRIAMANRQAENLFRYRRGELHGKAIEVLVPARFSHHEKLRSKFLTHPESRPMGVGRDLYARRKDNSEFPVEIGLSTLHADGNNYVLATVVDITDRKRLEERFRSTVESAPTAMVMIDRKGLIVLVNAETERMFGYKRSALLEQPVEILIPARFSSNHPAMRTGFFEKPSARAMGSARDLYARRSDGSEFPVEIGLNPVDAPDGPFVLAAIADITWRKQAENTLRSTNEELERRVAERTAELAGRAEELASARDALERSNLDLQQFAYVASHDLQTPLRNITGFAQLMQRTYGGRLDSTADDWLQRIVNGTQRMHALVRDLLAFSRVDSAARPFGAADLNTVFDDVVSWLKPAIDGAGALVTRDNLPVVIGDSNQLAQLLQNLIGNAILYRGEATPQIHVSARSENDHWMVSVRDNGIGIDPRHQERIFEIFQRLHTQRDYPGTGIGLAICRRVVNRHGGRIWIESTPGAGSTFLFTLPGTPEEPHD